MTAPRSPIATMLALLAVAFAASCHRPDHSAQAGAESAATPEPVPVEKFIEVGDIRTRYLEAGHGDPLVLVHGGGFADGVNGDRWDRNIAPLAREFHVFALDKLGQGFTDNPRRDEDCTMKAVVTHAAEFIRTLGLSRVHLVGASRGAYVVARLTLDHPDLVRTLVLCNTGSLAPETADRARRDQTVFGEAPKEVRAAAIHRLKQLSYSAEHITDETIDLQLKIIRSPKSQQARARMEVLEGRFRQLLAHEKKETLRRLQAGELTVPTLVTWGYDDRSAIIQNGMALFDLLAAGNPRTRMYIMPRAGHYNYRELPDDFNRVVSEFINANKSQP